MYSPVVLVPFLDFVEVFRVHGLFRPEFLENSSPWQRRLSSCNVEAFAALLCRLEAEKVADAH